MHTFQYEQVNALPDRVELELALDIIEMLDSHGPSADWEATRKDAMLGALTKIL